MTPKRIVLAPFAALLAVATVGAASRPPVTLVWHVEGAAGEVVDSRQADASINPASIVKVATSGWALEQLGAEHRFVTRFHTDGTLDPATGVLDGDLIVSGDGDPDFHVENAFLLARALNRIGLKRVGGRLLVDDGFWLGWEGGSSGRKQSPDRRATRMAVRLRDALDASRWDAATREALRELALRRGIEGEMPRVIVDGPPGRSTGPRPETVVALHRSNPLHHTLKRFNAYSNNDIERLEHALGEPGALEQRLSVGWEDPDPPPRFATLSGLGVNRLTPRQVVRLLHEFGAACSAQDRLVSDILPAAGCDPGTLKHYPGWFDRLPGGALVVKTGTLIETDGGVGVLAGYAHTLEGTKTFCVASPGAGRRMQEARRAMERWVLDLFERHGGPRSVGCGRSVGYSDDDAWVISLN